MLDIMGCIVILAVIITAAAIAGYSTYVTWEEARINSYTGQSIAVAVLVTVLCLGICSLAIGLVAGTI